MDIKEQRKSMKQTAERNNELVKLQHAAKHAHSDQSLREESDVVRALQVQVRACVCEKEIESLTECLRKESDVVCVCARERERGCVCARERWRV